MRKVGEIGEIDRVRVNEAGEIELCKVARIFTDI